jgi:hypothetical protein
MTNLTSEQVEIIKDQIGESVSYGSMYPNVARTLVEILEAAINYTHSCTELRDKETPKIEDWLKDNFKRLDRHSFTNIHEDTVWLRSELVEVYNQLHP